MAADSHFVRRMGVDIGGTFTDTAAIDSKGRICIGKMLTTPRREVDGVLDSVKSSGVDIREVDLFVHGTTMVINALLERRGATTALVTTAGFADVLELGRGSRPEPFNPTYRRDAPLVPAPLRFEVRERTSAGGEVLQRPSSEELDLLADTLRQMQVESIAVAFLHSYRNPETEHQVAEALRSRLPDVFVTASSDLGRQWREYERFNTAAANAYVGPPVRRYVTRLVDGLRSAGFAGDALYLDAGGGAVSGETVERYPIRLVESGPVGGVIGSAAIATALGLRHVVTLDIGGTTAKSSLIENGRFETLEEYWVGGYETGVPIQVPVVDIHEVGSGGGSIAWEDDGRLRVGPRSAGAEPGPAAYGNGGMAPTVTDALVVCGRLHPECFLASLTLRSDLAEQAIAKLAARLDMAPMRMALGILELAQSAVAGAVRRQTLERGLDPAGFTMVVSGGAGPAQACAVAASVGIHRVLVPRSPGHFSAIGMLQADLRFSMRSLVEKGLAQMTLESFRGLCATVEQALQKNVAGQSRYAEGSASEVSVAVRYLGQDHHIRLPLDMQALAANGVDFSAAVAKQFNAQYQQRYGYVDLASPIEIVDVEVAVIRRLPAQPDSDHVPGQVLPRKTVHCLFDEASGPVETVAAHRSSLALGDSLVGPALIYEQGSITVVPPGWTASVIQGHNLLLEA